MTSWRLSGVDTTTLCARRRVGRADDEDRDPDGLRGAGEGDAALIRG